MQHLRVAAGSGADEAAAQTQPTGGIVDCHRIWPTNDNSAPSA